MIMLIWPMRVLYNRLASIAVPSLGKQLISKPIAQLAATPVHLCKPSKSSTVESLESFGGDHGTGSAARRRFHGSRVTAPLHMARSCGA